MEITIGEYSVQDSQVVESPQGILSFFDLNHVGDKVKKLATVGGSSLIEENTIQPVVIILGVFLLTALFASLFQYITNITSNLIRALSTKLIRQDITNHLLSLDMSFFHNQKVGELISRFTNDAGKTAIGIGPLLHGFLHHGILIVVYSLYLFSTDPFLTLGAIGIIFFQTVITKFIKNPVRVTECDHNDKIAKLISTLQETLTSIRVIKSFGADAYEQQKIQYDIDIAKQAEFKASLIKEIEPRSREFLDSFAIAGIFMIGTIQLNSDQLTIQGFILFMFIGKLIINPINKFSVNFVWMHALMASYGRIHELLKIENDVKDGKVFINKFQKNILVEKVDFSYGNIDVLHNVSFELKKGEVLAIIGPSGSGKSTLTDLILRLYDPTQGNVFIDDENLKTIQGSQFRKLFGVVSQESLLFNDTITNNIRFGRKDISCEDVEAAAKIANAHEFIKRLPQGYQTIVGDRGIKLSGGQRQRISIARAVCSKPEIFIFDEATSSLDSDSESKVQNAIDKVLDMSTAIIIAHRLSTILHADKIMVLSGGRVEAIGIHDDLINSSSTYKRLYNMQFDKHIELH